MIDNTTRKILPNAPNSGPSEVIAPHRSKCGPLRQENPATIQPWFDDHESRSLGGRRERPAPQQAGIQQPGSLRYPALFGASAVV